MSYKPKKRDAVLVALGESPEKWNAYLLSTYGLPQDPQPRHEVSESAFTNREGCRSPLEAVAGRQIRLGEEPPKGLSKVWAENSSHENEPTEQWKRARAFLSVFARIFAHEKKLSKQKLAELLKNVDDSRPGADLGEFPEEMGTPEEFYRRWRGYEIDVQFVNENRASQRITYFQHTMPPDEWEDVDPAGEPPGHWDGLKFIPDPPEK